MYVRHLAKSRQLLGYGMEWMPNAVQGDVKGLSNAMDVNLKFDNYMNLRLFRRVILAETLATNFGKSTYLSFLSSRCGPLPMPSHRDVRRSPRGWTRRRFKLTNPY